jgi:putative restriction endonuclease
MEWKDAVRLAISRHCRAIKSDIFTRKGLINTQMDRIIADTGSKGDTPDQTLSRILQELRDADEIEFIDDHGTYCKLF